MIEWNRLPVNISLIFLKNKFKQEVKATILNPYVKSVVNMYYHNSPDLITISLFHAILMARPKVIMYLPAPYN